MDCMKNKAEIEIIEEDKVRLTQEQENLIILAFEKQVPPEDAEFLEKIQKGKNATIDVFNEVTSYFVSKYGIDFGALYLAAISGGEERYNEAVNSLELKRAQERIKRDTQN